MENTKQVQTWEQFYGKPLSVFEFIVHTLPYLYYFIRIIRQKPKRILEVGGGTAAHSIFLSYFPIKNLVILDSDPALIRDMGTNIKKFGKSRKLYPCKADAFKVPFKDDSFDMCISQGFLEHFNDDEIIELLNEQLRVAKKVIFSVPSDKYPGKDFGNERLLSPEQWLGLLDDRLDNVAVESKYAPFDLAIRIRIGLCKARKSFSAFITTPLQVIVTVTKLSDN
ncbi:methyltransferase domain-containing protein [Chloroflexota bacterium]